VTHCHLVPETGDGIVILTNSQRSWPFMAQILSDWARWRGFGAVKMGRITAATIALQVLIGDVVLTALWPMVRLARGLRSGRRQLAPRAQNSRRARLLQAALGGALLAVLVWRAAQPYLFVSSIFLTTAGWAAVGLFGMAVILLLSALLPRGEAQSSLG
jgi:hypothetical protein